MPASSSTAVEWSRSGVLTFWFVVGGLLLSFGCVGLAPYVFKEEWPELSYAGMAGTWTSTTGAVLELNGDGTAHMENLPGDVWGRRLTDQDSVEIHGSWRLCGGPPHRGTDCEPPEDGIFLSLHFLFDVVSVNGDAKEANGLLTNVEVTEKDSQRTLWFSTHPDVPEDPRTKFLKSSS